MSTPPFFCQRRHFALLELLIAMSLTMLLLVVLFGAYSYVEKANVAAEKAQNRSFDKLYLSTRLAEVIPKAVGANDPEKDFLFFTSLDWDGVSQPGSKSLLLTFDNGVKLSPDFSNHVIGKLYLDRNGTLKLATWPSHLRWQMDITPPIKQESLIDSVEKVNLEFYLPPHRDRKEIWSSSKLAIKESKAPLESQGSWLSDWHQEYDDLPPLVKITLQLKRVDDIERIDLVYSLPKSKLFILYDQ